MASSALSVEHLTITITGTNTTGTASISKSQTSADCILIPTQKSPGSASTINTRLCEVYFSDSTTVTAQRSTGTDIGTITINVEVVEFDSAKVKVQAGTFSMGNGTSSTTATPSTVSALTAAFAVANTRTSYSATNYARNAFCRMSFTNTSTLTFARSAATNTLQGRWFVAEALASEFSVQHGVITLANSAEVNPDPLETDVDLGKTAAFVTMLNGHTADDWRTTGVRARLEDVATIANIIIERANGGAASATAVTCDFAAVTFAGDETVQRGTVTITGTTVDSSALGTAVDLDTATVHSPMYHGLGEADSTDGTLVSNFHAHMTLSSTTVVTTSVVTDVTPDALYAFEVIDWKIPSAGQTLAPTFTGAGTLAVVSQVNVPFLPVFTGTGSLALVTQVGIRWLTLGNHSGTGSLAIVFQVGNDQNLSPTFVGTGSLALVTQVAVPLSTAFTGTGSLAIAAQVGVLLAPAFTGSGSLALTSQIGMPLVPVFTGSGSLALIAQIAVPLFTVFTGSGSLALVSQVNVLLAPTFTGVGTLAVVLDVGGGQTLSPIFTGVGTVALAYSVDIPLTLAMTGVGTMVLVASALGPVDSKQLFGRFVVYDPDGLGELALRKIAYLRQRGR